MTLLERYSDLNQTLTIFGKTHASVIEGEITIDKLKMYALRCIQSGVPALVNIGFEVNRNIAKANNCLNSKIL